MIIDELIKNECTIDMKAAWREYRDKLTEFIIGSVENYELKRWLKKNKRVREAMDFSMEEIARRYEMESGAKPTLAIWGAGCLCDIDISVLAKYFRLVLIDRDICNIEKARSDAGLGKNVCACIDIKFFDITYDEYEMFEAMLQDGCSKAQLEEYILEIIEEDNCCYNGASFDYSVCVGVASQLVSRLAALSYRYGRLGELESLLRRLSGFAVERLLDALLDCTKMGIIAGYEMNEVYVSSTEFEKLGNRKDYLNDTIHEYKADGSLKRILEDNNFSSSVTGNSELIDCIKNALSDKQIKTIMDGIVLEWPFTKEKHYLVNTLVCEMN